MPDTDYDKQTKLQNIFLPYTKQRIDEIKAQKGKFVHYTSAENAISIINSKKLWMRNTKCMNDYMEVVHGHDLLVKFFEKHRKLFYEVLEPFGKETGQTSLNLFDQWWNNIEVNTFIASISEHEPSEDINGRLSMWRAYGQPSAKAAIVLNIPFEPRGAVKGLQLILSPVFYFRYEDLEEKLFIIVDNIRKNTNYLLSLEVQEIVQSIFAMLLISAVGLKHEGFKEEKEWRIIYLPTLRPSKLISHCIETINGIPQAIYQIPLEENPKEDVIGVAIPKLVERIIIGPSKYPIPMYQAFTAELRKAGVENLESKVIISDIPLRM